MKTKEIPLLEGIERHLRGEKGIKILVPRPINALYTLEDMAQALKGEVRCIAEEDAVEQMKEQEKQIPKEDKTPKNKEGGRRKIDRGKVEALAAAGWTNKAIADEIGCSTGSVSMILKGEKDDKS